MSSPALPRPDDTAPPQREQKGLVCPRCRHRSDDLAPTSGGAVPKCASDGTPLVLLRDLIDADYDPMLGRTLGGRFTLLARLGAGSMGTVYRARQHPVGRDVALKILRSDRAIDEVSRARFLREARANSQLASPNTVTVFDFGQHEDGDFFLAMEMLEGESLGQRLRRLGRLPPDVAIETARQALQSLAEAHEKGIIHRDLKPDNLFFARVPGAGPGQEVVKVLDFGIAKMLRDPSEPLNAVETQAGTVFGTPRYMSPEQAQAKPLDARSDLYSLGVILYHMLAGRPPFMDDDAIVVMARHIKTKPIPFAEACTDAAAYVEIEKVVMRALAKDPGARFEGADAMASELRRALECDLASTSGVRRSLAERRLTTPPAGVAPLAPTSTRPAPLASADDSLAGPAPANRGRRALLVGALAATLLAGIAAAVVATRAPPAAEGPLVRASSADRATTPREDVPRTVASAPAPSPPLAAPGGTTIHVESLPQAPAPARARLRSGAPHRAPQAGAQDRAGSTPAARPTATGGYGLFE